MEVEDPLEHYAYGSEEEEEDDEYEELELQTMSMRLVSSGSYNVRASEMAHDRPVQKTIDCIVHFLDDTEATFEVDKRIKGQHLLDKVFDHLELVEKDYFGLQFVDGDELSRDSMRWLDPLKILKKQFKEGPPYELFFRVKFYMTDPSRLNEEYTRYHFFLQLKRDILEERLVCLPKTAALLASYTVQSELGDYNPDEHIDGYLTEFTFLPNQTREFEQYVCDYHRQHRGQTPADAEYEFLETAKHLDMYGVDLHCARDQTNVEIQLGVTATGLVIFRNNVRINAFSWAKIVKISFKRKQFFIQLRRDSNDTVDNLIGFNMVSYRQCKNLWKSCIEHHTFFRLHAPNPPSKKIFSLGSKFRYSGRTEFQTLEDSKRRMKVEKSFSRSPSKRFARRTVGGITRDVIREEKNIIDGYRNIPKSNSFGGSKSNGQPPAVLNHHGGGTGSGHPQISVAPITRYEGGINRGRATLPADYQRKRTSWNVSTNNRQSQILDDKIDDDGGFLARTVSTSPPPGPCIKVPPPPAPSGQLTVNHNNPPQRTSNTVVVKSATPSTYIEDSTTNNVTDTIYELPSYNNDLYLANSNGYNGDNQSLVTIRIQPDDQGRFGFNVKGGADQGMPIIVSRVAPNTPADLCMPRLNEGDQVLFINDRGVSQHTHEQVVMFIRASRETHSGELQLIVRPNVYVGEDTSEEPDFMYIPETHQIISSAGGNALDASLMLLNESLESNAALAQFEQLYRKKPGLTMISARIADNIPKNRYRDISPYDQTRVVLKGCQSTDYVNANFVNMEIPGSGIVNRYIAAQGPLPNTCVDFWQMVWEQQSSLVVMLTAKVERGRPKCHQYWPDLYETTDFGTLQITCVKEEENASFAFREFTLTHVETNEERHIVHMQYIAWPDHGVPDDSSDFLDFVLKVRQNRVGMVEPTVVHCSAGIGRTGVLITMETAMCLIEANQAVYPLVIVRQMRDQRAMLIQTASQYKFVCEAILRVYNEGLVKPLDDYRR